MILSIDVGIKNLAYIIYDKGVIQDWNVIKLTDKNTKTIDMIEISIELKKELDKLGNDFETILIENQIGRNAIRMKNLQTMISFYYVMKGNHNIVYWNSSNKLKFFIKTKTTYSERKKVSIQITKQFIEHYHPDYIVFFSKNKKKDDLSDCYLQLLNYLHKKNSIKEDYFSIIKL